MNYVEINKGKQMRTEVIYSELARGRESASITAFGRDSKAGEWKSFMVEKKAL